jgi:hypothetical protein
MIKFLRDATSPQVIRSIFFAYSHAHLKYGLVFWGGDSKSKTIFKLQKRVKLSSCRQLFKDLNPLPLPCMYIFEIVCYTKLHLEKLEQHSAVHNYNTRQGLISHVQFCRTNVLKNGVMNMGIKLCNKIPIKIWKEEKIDILKEYLGHICYNIHSTL